MYDINSLDAEAAFRRYEEIRDRLPLAQFPDESQTYATLADISDRYDAFVLDSFGVLNVGDHPIPGAADRIAQFRALGKPLVVLTNAASYSRMTAHHRYQRQGFDFAPEEIVSSRDVAAAHLGDIAPAIRWAAISAEGDGYSDIPHRVEDLLENPDLWDQAEGFLFLSSIRWTVALQDLLVAALDARPRPVVVANPDLVAPRGDGLSIEPGYWGHDLADRTGQMPHFFGKPYGAAFDAVCARLGGRSAAMVGDTLHTDILGGSHAGLGTILVADHGLFAGQDVGPFVTRSGIVPDVIVSTT